VGACDLASPLVEGLAGHETLLRVSTWPSEPFGEPLRSFGTGRLSGSLTQAVRALR